MESLSELTQRMARIERQGEFIKSIWCAGLAAIDGQRPSEICARQFPGDSESSADGSIRHEPNGRKFLGVTRRRRRRAATDVRMGVPAETVGRCLGKANFRRANFDTRTALESTRGTAAWVEASGQIPASKMSLSAVALNQTKIASLTFFTVESFEVWTAATANMIPNALQKTVMLYTDTALLQPEIPASAEEPGITFQFL